MPADLAFDRSERFTDQDGHLHVRSTFLSKACVNPYKGSEIPGWQELGLDPDKVYRLFRHPDELTKAAPTFNNLRLLSRHTAVDAANPKEDLVAGSTGSDARFEYPYIVNSLVVWRAQDIVDVESREKCQLSAGYYYRPDMTPGTHEGQPYDGVMREIRANHIALVEAGRAGPDVMVHDSKESPMHTRLVSAKALMVKGALTALLRPNLLPGTTLALDQALGSVNRLNWKTQRPIVLATVEAMVKGSLKPGIAFDSLRAAFDEAEEEDGETAEDDEVEAMDAAEEAEEARARAEEEKAGASAEDRARGARDRRGARDAKRAMDARRGARDAKRASDKKARDAEMQAWREAGKDRKALDKLLGHKATDEEFGEWAKEEMDEPDHARDRRGARDTETEEERMERERREAANDKRAKDEMTADIRAMVMAQMNAAIAARQEVRPHVGEVSLALDSAEAIYAFALKAKKVPLDGVHPSAYRAMVGMIRRDEPAKRAEPLALDAAGASGLDDMFPMGAHINLA